MASSARCGAWVVAAGVILLLEGLQHLNKWQENWMLYRS